MTPYLTTADTANDCALDHRMRAFIARYNDAYPPVPRPVNPGPRALDVGHCVVSIRVALPSYDRCRTHPARRYIRAGHLLSRVSR